MEGAGEYVVVGGAAATFEALREVVGQRRLSVVEEDLRHRRLAVRLDEPQGGGQIKVMCAILDVGHGFSKLVAVCIDEANGSVVAPDATLASLFIQVDHALQTVSGKQKDALVG